MTPTQSFPIAVHRSTNLGTLLPLAVILLSAISIYLSHQANEATLRLNPPKLYTTILVDPAAGGGLLPMSVQLRNIGNSAADQVTLYGNATIAPNTARFQPMDRSGAQKLGMPVLMAGAGQTREFLPFPITKGSWNDVASGKSHLFVSGQILYRDSHGICHEQQFCRTYHKSEFGPGGTMEACPIYNDVLEAPCTAN